MNNEKKESYAQRKMCITLFYSHYEIKTIRRLSRCENRVPGRIVDMHSMQVFLNVKVTLYVLRC